MHGDDDLLPTEDGFPRPDRDTVAELFEGRPEPERDALWRGRALRRVEATGMSMSPDYAVSHSENFPLLSAQGERYASLLPGFLERALSRILAALEGTASDEGYAWHVVLMFDEQDDCGLAEQLFGLPGCEPRPDEWTP